VVKPQLPRPTGLSSKVNKSLIHLRKIEDRVTGFFFYSHKTFYLKNKIMEWLLFEKLPSCGFF
jgi:hypothetical protein